MVFPGLDESAGFCCHIAGFVGFIISERWDSKVTVSKNHSGSSILAALPATTAILRSWTVSLRSMIWKGSGCCSWEAFVMPTYFWSMVPSTGETGIACWRYTIRHRSPFWWWPSGLAAAPGEFSLRETPLPDLSTRSSRWMPISPDARQNRKPL